MTTSDVPVLENISLAVEGDTATATLSRPSKANAVNRQMLRDLIHMSDWLAEQDDIHFLVLTHDGKVFAAGQDLGELHAELSDPAARRSNARSLQHLAQEMMRKLEGLQQIVFVGLRGSAYGAGMTIATTGDFRIMADTAVANLPEVRLGMFLTYGSLPRLVRTIGLSRAMEFVMFARDVTASELLSLGAVEDVVPEDDVVPLIRRRIDELRAMDIRALRLTKRVARAAAATAFGDVLHAEPELVEGSIADGELLPRLEAFLTRRG